MALSQLALSGALLPPLQTHSESSGICSPQVPSTRARALSRAPAATRFALCGRQQRRDLFLLQGERKKAFLGLGVRAAAGENQKPSDASDSLDDLCPSLESEAWKLLQGKPAAPVSPQQQLWPTLPAKPAQPGWGQSWPTQGPGRGPRQSRPGVGKSLEDEESNDDYMKAWERGPGTSPRQTHKKQSWREPSQEWPRPRQPGPSFAELLQAGQEWGPPKESGEGVEGTPTSYHEMRQEHWAIRQTLYSFLHGTYECGEELKQEDLQFVVENALSFHPKAPEKMGSGVASIKVDMHPEFKDTKCFFVKTEDAEEWEDFSYLKCLEARFSAKKSRLDAFRKFPRIMAATRAPVRSQEPRWAVKTGKSL